MYIGGKRFCQKGFDIHLAGIKVSGKFSRFKMGWVRLKGKEKKELNTNQGIFTSR